MEFHPSERKVSLSVREFAEFRETSHVAGVPGTGIWRASVGTSWHRELEKEAADEKPETRFEIPLDVHWIHRDWKLRFQGRMDQAVIQSDCIRIREVKTVNRRLPLPAEEIESHYSAYLRQLAAYCVLAGQLRGFCDKTVEGLLLFVDIESGIRQNFRLPDNPETYFEEQLEVLYPFLQSRWTGYQRRRRLNIRPPFRQYREGQQESMKTLEQYCNRSSVVFFQAPTGFGKTGIALEQGLKMLRSGTFDRLLYLTSKSTGQLQVLNQLSAMLPWESDPPRYFQIRNRREHEAGLLDGLNPDRGQPDLDALWERSGLQPRNLLETEPLTLDRIRDIATQTGIPPYEITRAALPYADIWLGDYNYIFAPSTRGVLDNTPGFNPQSTFLILDEAHNLPSRAASALSGIQYADAWENLSCDLDRVSAPRKILKALRNWHQFLGGLKPSESHASTIEYEITDLIEEACRAVTDCPFDWRELPQASADLLYSLFAIRNFIHHPHIEKLYWSQKRAELHLTCLDASSEIRQQLLRFGNGVLMSATLHPVEPFAVACGLNPAETLTLDAPALWREHAYTMAVDTRVDTRWKQREAYYPKTAETIRLFRESSRNPVAVFFPSYRYAETILEYLKASDPLFRVMIQPRGVSLLKQEAFIESAVRFCDALFLVLGTGFSEGIDSLGGVITDAIVVGPALPEVNSVQRARMEQIGERNRSEAFLRVYQIPAIQKINQALGRLVRSPGQRARVLLHCRRFAQKEYQSLLDETYRMGDRLDNDDEFLLWLEDSRIPVE